MTNEEARKILDSSFVWQKMVDEECEALGMAIKALEQEPCEDAISRQTVINAIANTCFWLSSDNWKELIKCINSIPLVKPQEPKIGHWEWVQYDYNSKLGNWHCSECRCIVVECVNKEEKGGIPLYKYCPQCGTKMVELQKSEGKE